MPDIKQFFEKNNWKHEKTVIGKEWWYVRDLVDQLSVPCDIDILSIDLSVLPWDIRNFGDFVGHILNIEQADKRYPVLVSPDGWILNGWHRVAKAILAGEKTIKAKRLLKMPEPDGVEE